MPPTPPHTLILPALAVNALLCLFTAALGLLLADWPPQASAHVAFALGVMPLIIAAMGYLIPVLTRQAPTTRPANLAAGLAWLAGVLAVTAFAVDFRFVWLLPAAALAALAAGLLGHWAIRLAKRGLGPRHRGLDWYLGALGFLCLALLAVALMPLWPEQRQALRLFHLHANLLGFVGLTAIGTLHVLLPTCLGRPDPQALPRLRGDLPWTAAGIATISLGAALPAPGFALLGAGALLFLLLRLLRRWWQLYGRALLGRDGAAGSLVAATLGLVGLLVAGMAHAFGLGSGRQAIVALVVAFLLPLVSGATAQLLPVWLRPGAQTPWHQQLRSRLGHYAGLRGGLLLIIGLLLLGV